MKFENCTKLELPFSSMTSKSVAKIGFAKYSTPSYKTKNNISSPATKPSF